MQPLLLHTSLGIFALAFIVFIYNLNPSTTWTTVAVAITGFVVYLGTILLTAFAVETPYRVPVLYRPIHSFFRLLQLGWFTLLKFLGQPRTKEVFHPSIIAPSLRPMELTITDSREKRLALTMSALSWLHSVSVNRTVHRAIVESIAFLRPTSDDPQAWEHWVGRNRGSLEQLLSPSFLGMLWNYISPSSHSPTGDPLCDYATCGALMATLEAFYRHGLVLVDYLSGLRDAMFRAVEYNAIGYTEFILLERRVEVAGPVYRRTENGETLLEMAMRLGRAELATLLKQHGSTTRDEKRSVQVAPPTGMALDRGRASAKSHADFNGVVDPGKK
ncbi:hypothetical protein B0H11DRAFT_2228634 [Mycena galericulata]|nr:hypothetical protein B0H11DRAFT_2228634 [Mycena galericulata]